jgi:hypothetical protein
MARVNRNAATAPRRDDEAAAGVSPGDRGAGPDGGAGTAPLRTRQRSRAASLRTQLSSRAASLPRAAAESRVVEALAGIRPVLSRGLPAFRFGAFAGR